MRHPILALCNSAILATTAMSAPQQHLEFSIDWQSPTVGLIDPITGHIISEGDILGAPGGIPQLGPLPSPQILLSNFDMGLISGCIGHLGGTPCDMEIDAMSAGTDYRFLDNGILPGELFFSVDQFAMGGPMTTPPPTIQAEYSAGDISSDLWTNWAAIAQNAVLPPAPLYFANHVGVVDGDGMASSGGYQYPGIGLIEPNHPGGGLPNTNANQGDNMDAATMRLASSTSTTYYSLDGGVHDPLSGIPGSDSAGRRGVAPGDILVSTTPGAPLTVWAKAVDLGLDRTGMSLRDDLDALAIYENGNGVFDPSGHPYDWFSGTTDMVLFSVRRGSPVIGRPDSRFGIPICEGDILTTPLLPVFGGTSPFPAIMVTADHLGLQTPRSGAPGVTDDLNALAFLEDPLHDCNASGVEDAAEIVTGVLADLDGDGVADSCGAILDATGYCYCASVAPCGNIDPTAGCVNSTGVGALLTASGSSVVSLDNLRLDVSNLPSGTFGLFFMGPAATSGVPLRDGLFCVSGLLHRYLPAVYTGPGVAHLGPGIVAHSHTGFSSAGAIVVGSTWNYQLWYRNTGGPCSMGSNFTNALAVTFH